MSKQQVVALVDNAKKSARESLTWRNELRRDKAGKIIADEANVLSALRLAPLLRDAVAYNEFAGATEVAAPLPWRPDAAGTPWGDVDDTGCMVWLQQREIQVRTRIVVGCAIEQRAHERKFHPLREHLAALVWDGQPRIATFLSTVCKAENAPAYLSSIWTAWMVSAVARAFEPGCKVDHVPVLTGPQGVGKSTLARLLATRAEFFADQLPDLGNKDAAMQLSGRWIIELGELAATRRAELETVKSFLTRSTDTYRPPFGKRTVQAPRQCVFLGSTNETAFLRDHTGNRRFWPVRVGRIDLDRVAAEVPQLWAEAVHLYRAGTPWHLTGDAAALALAEADRHRVVTEVERMVAEYTERLLVQGVREVSMRAVLTEALHLDSTASDYGRQAGAHGPEVAAILTRLGWRQAGVIGRGDRRRNLYTYAGDSSQGFPR